MTKAGRVNFIIHKLEELYPNPEIPLQHKDAYTMLIAVLLSAQCTDKRVNLTTPLLFKKANTPQQMVKLPVSEIQEIIMPCGLAPAKAKAIKLFTGFLKYYLKNIMARFLKHLKNWKNCRV
jgi:endonuclease III